MALVKCRECGKDVSTEAAACPHCGVPSVESTNDAPPPAQPPSGKSKGSPIGGAIALMITIAVIVSMCSSGDDKNKETKKEENCAKDDLQCLGDKAVVAAGVYCKTPIERLATHSVRWTDGTFEMKFSRFRWKNKEAGQLTMIGDKAEFQNAFGAYTPVIYECDLDADGKTVLDVRVSEGRLPN
jgi:hypothetical protein